VRWPAEEDMPLGTAFCAWYVTGVSCRRTLTPYFVSSIDCQFVNFVDENVIDQSVALEPRTILTKFGLIEDD